MPLRRQVIFSALAAGGPSQATSAEALQRLLFDVFQRDVREFRCACQPSVFQVSWSRLMCSRAAAAAAAAAADQRAGVLTSMC